MGEIWANSQYSSPFSLVVELSVPLTARLDGLPKLFVSLARCLTGFQNPWTLADCLFKRVACKLGELWINVFDIAGGIGNHDRAWALFESLHDPLEFIPSPCYDNVVLVGSGAYDY